MFSVRCDPSPIPRFLSLIPLALTLALAATACASQPVSLKGSQFIVVRHAEKADDDPRDPSLSAAGRTRAEALARLLSRQPVRAAYATPFRRTQQTAEPTARAHGLSVVAYDPRLPATDFAATLRSAHPNGTVLVVGHSNTAPAIAAALCQCEVPAMGEDEFDRLMRITTDPSGQPHLTIVRQP